MLKQKPINKYKCVICRSPAAFYVGNKKVCSDECRTKLIQITLEKAVKKREKKERKETRELKQRLKSMSTVCSEAQEHVNKLITTVDRSMGYKCIATGREICHAGHYIHAGTKYRISWLRFMHFNIQGQNDESNTHQSGDTVNYRMGLVERYGEQYAKDLEEFKRMTDHGLIPSPTREEVAGMVKWCREMTEIYKKRL